MPEALSATVAANVMALLRHRYPDMRAHEKGITRLIELGVSHGTSARVLKGTTQVGLAVIEEVAAALKVQPWQLLVPKLDAANLPGTTAAPAWPFEMVPAQAYWSLPAQERLFVQGRLQQWLEQAGAKMAAEMPARLLGNGH